MGLFLWCFSIWDLVYYVGLVGDDPLANIAARHRCAFPNPETMFRGALVSGVSEWSNRISGDARGAANVARASTISSARHRRIG
jgi:hypothetical protein